MDSVPVAKCISTDDAWPNHPFPKKSLPPTVFTALVASSAKLFGNAAEAVPVIVTSAMIDRINLFIYQLNRFRAEGKVAKPYTIDEMSIAGEDNKTKTPTPHGPNCFCFKASQLFG